MPPADKPDPKRRIIDLDAAAAERAKARGDVEPVKITYSSVEFTLPIELPFGFVYHAERDELGSAVRVLLGDQAEKFFELGPSMDDISGLMEAAAGIYGDTGAAA